MKLSFANKYLDLLIFMSNIFNDIITITKKIVFMYSYNVKNFLAHIIINLLTFGYQVKLQF